MNDNVKSVIMILGAAELAILFSSYPIIFFHKMGKFGSLVFWYLSFASVITPLILWSNLESPAKMVVTGVCQITSLLLCWMCFALPQGINWRYYMKQKLFDREVDERKYILEKFYRKDING